MADLGVLHPREMGAALGAAASRSGAEVFWAPEGRSAATEARAREAGLRPAPLGDLLARCEVVLSVVPPHAALAVAEEVAGLRYGGVYVDANAVSPKTARSVAEAVCKGGASYVDGGIIGPPPWPGRSVTALCLSGPEAGLVAELFEGSPLVETLLLGEETKAASALKMCYAAWSKGSAALLLVVVTAARAYGVSPSLIEQWERRQPGLEDQAESAAAWAAPKAWRWVAEMEEISETFGSVGLPGGFHEAAAELYARMGDGDTASLEGGARDLDRVVASLHE
jgi:3-hydroxyisobutyrate dehydrogenase-like beta-hydroxyacid dehydrogenase